MAEQEKSLFPYLTPNETIFIFSPTAAGRSFQMNESATQLHHCCQPCGRLHSATITCNISSATSRSFVSPKHTDGDILVQKHNLGTSTLPWMQQQQQQQHEQRTVSTQQEITPMLYLTSKFMDDHSCKPIPIKLFYEVHFGHILSFLEYGKACKVGDTVSKICLGTCMLVGGISVYRGSRMTCWPMPPQDWMGINHWFEQPKL